MEHYTEQNQETSLFGFGIDPGIRRGQTDCRAYQCESEMHAPAIDRKVSACADADCAANARNAAG